MGDSEFQLTSGEEIDKFGITNMCGVGDPGKSASETKHSTEREPKPDAKQEAWVV